MIAILFVILVIIIACSWFIATKVFKSFSPSQNALAWFMGIGTFLVSFVILSLGVYLLIIYNIRIER